MHFPARTLLACWLTLVATGTDVAHRHASRAGHTHGFGWASIGAPARRGMPRAHHHLVLFGIEFGAAPGKPSGAPDGPRPVLAANALPALEADPDHPTAQLDAWLAPPALGGADLWQPAGAAGSLRPSSPAPPDRCSVLRL
jgi:hypothetical protein